jgi:hypothetical protein
MKWNGDNIERQLIEQVRANTLRGAEAIADLAAEKASEPYPPASKPGQPPRRRTGNLVRNIRARSGDASDIDEELSAYAFSEGASAKGFPYPAHLELKMQREYLVPAMDESHDAIMAEMLRSDIFDSVVGGAE